MALKTVDLTQQPHRVIFTGCSQEEVNYAKTFWQSLQLLPPMESRLVSSDIKQRLRKAPPSRSMSECVKEMKETEDQQSLSSFGLTLSNSSSQLDCCYGKITVYPRSCATTGSLKTQSSFIPDFGQPLSESEQKNSGSEGPARPHEEPGHRKISVSSKASSPQEGSQGATGCRPCSLGAGGREFWSRWQGGQEENAENELTRTILPFSGEDLCRRKGFINWGEQNFLSRATGDTGTTVECGGEELRGKQNSQHPTTTPHTVSESHANSQSARKVEEKAKTHLAENQSKKNRLYQDKKKQRVIETQQVISLFEAGNIEKSGDSFIRPDSFVIELFQPDLQMIPNNFTKHVESTERDYGIDNASIPENHSDILPPPQENLDHESQSQKGETKNDRTIQERSFTTAAPEPSEGCKSPATQPAMSSEPTDVQTGKVIPLPRLAGTPAVLTRPSKDLLYWTV